MIFFVSFPTYSVIFVIYPCYVGKSSLLFLILLWFSCVLRAHLLTLSTKNFGALHILSCLILEIVLQGLLSYFSLMRNLNFWEINLSKVTQFNKWKMCVLNNIGLMANSVLFCYEFVLLPSYI